MRDTYLSMNKEQVQNFLKRNPQSNIEKLADDIEPSELLQGIYGDGVSVTRIEELKNSLLNSAQNLSRTAYNEKAEFQRQAEEKQFKGNTMNRDQEIKNEMIKYKTKAEILIMAEKTAKRAMENKIKDNQ